jgi:three-Cys-motif partner protein
MKEDRPMFPAPDPVTPEPERQQEAPYDRLWTRNKALLIERYLYYFVLVTKHGTYIDGFAGPQDPHRPEAWAARLVLESRPPWLRHFHVCDNAERQLPLLHGLEADHPDRDITVWPGDFNEEVDRILEAARIRAREATFCLLDQRTFECRWGTLATLAGHKREGYKIELFYFLAEGWLGRALAETTTEAGRARIRDWWGRDNWEVLRQVTGWERARLFCRRFHAELGYWSVRPYAIYDEERGNRVMYYMLHATDHPEAPALMGRAYIKAALPKESLDQLALDLGAEPPGVEG